MLLLDEPLSNLDLKLREEMRIEISSLQRRLGIATVFVTHDQGEALTMSDRIAVMRQGRIEQLGTPADIYERPASRFVASFIGSINLLPVQAMEAPTADGMVQLQTAVGPAMVRLATGAAFAGHCLLAVRPERLKFATAKQVPDGVSALSASVERVVYLGARIELRLRLADGSTAIVEAMHDGSAAWNTGDVGLAWFRPDDAWLVNAE
jgi:ABC-type Fe3+/spermidine/putrescine transport system ATPase subunit